MLPTPCTLSSDLLNVRPDPLTSRGYGDIHEGFLDGVRVCVKRLRMYAQDTPQQDINVGYLAPLFTVAHEFYRLSAKRQ